MQANWREIAKAFNENHNYVLATIIETRGATYQKAGAMMLINEQGDCFGLLSGGCLEADISLHAKQVLLHKQSQVISYDLSVDADLLWGLGLGCDGAIDILLQPLLLTNNHLGFCHLLGNIKAQQSGYYLQKLPSEVSPKSSKKMPQNATTEYKNNAEPFAEFVLSETIDYSKIKTVSKSLQQGKSLVVTPIKPPINLLVCGAGPDVVPVAKFAEQMGWQVTLWDHRKSHLHERSFDSYQRRCVRAKDTNVDDYGGFDAAIVMTHNLTMDGEYLAKLIATSAIELSYIGLLGPQSRRDKLLSVCDVELSQAQHRVHGPIGLNLGGRGAEAIALSIISEIQQHFYTHLSTKQNCEQSVICSVNDVEIINAKTKSIEIKSGVEYA